MLRKCAKDLGSQNESSLDGERHRTSYQYLRIYCSQFSDLWRRIVDGITRRSEQIAEQPLSGRKVPEYDAEDIRELIEKPYRIIYRIKPDQIDVLAVIHGARLLPDEF
jgi:toxin ParE1/3/4